MGLRPGLGSTFCPKSLRSNRRKLSPLGRGEGRHANIYKNSGLYIITLGKRVTKIYFADAEEMLRLIKERKTIFSVYGLGYIGTTTVAVLLSRGFRVVGYDENRERLREIERGTIRHIDMRVREEVLRGYREGLLEISYDGVEASRKSDVKIIDVPLSWGPRGPNFTAIDRVSETIAGGMSPGDIVVLETTVPPGTAETRVKKILEDVSGLSCGKDFGLSYSPQRVSIERAYEDLAHRYPKIVGGVDKKSPKILEILFKEIYGSVIVMSSSRAAEFEKIAEGVYRDANIAIANELARAARELGVDIWEVISVTRTNPYIDIHSPGPGVGGASLPYQPYLLAWSVGRSWIWDSVIIRARRTNEEQPSYIAQILVEGLRLLGIEVDSARIAILGLAYKGDVDDDRNSPAYGVAEYLAERGVNDIAVHDPYVKRWGLGDRVRVRLTGSLEEALRGSDGVVLVTDHSVYKDLGIDRIASLSGKDRIVIVDSRKILSPDLGGKGLEGSRVRCIYITPGSNSIML